MRFLICVSICFLLGINSFAQAYKIDPVRADSNLKKTEFVIISSIQIIGNKITKNQIITRELEYAIGDSIQSDEFLALTEQSKKNILNTSLFNFASIEYAFMDHQRLFIIINVIERWYTLPLPIFEIEDNNFNTWWREKDLSRINYGFHLTRNNFRGRKEDLKVTAQFGFTERIRLRYDIPYISKNQKGGLGFKFSYNRRDEITYNSFDNERLQFKSQTADALKNYSAGVNYKYRNAIFNTHAVGFEFDQNEVLDSVRILNPNFLGQGRKAISYFSLFYIFTHDRRDSRNYPLEGDYARLLAQKTGLGIRNNGVDITNFDLQYKRFWALGKRLFLANSIRTEFALNNNQPYILRNGIGYSSSYHIRGYEYYVIDGQNIILNRNQIRYQIVKPRSADIKFIGYDKLTKFHYAFYLGLFTDFAFVEANGNYPENNLANQWLFGSGIGLDFVSYYDVVIRTEYSFNKLGESGIFLHFVAPI